MPQIGLSVVLYLPNIVLIMFKNKIFLIRWIRGRNGNFIEYLDDLLVSRYNIQNILDNKYKYVRK